jgi:hypothetical protein
LENENFNLNSPTKLWLPPSKKRCFGQQCLPTRLRLRVFECTVQHGGVELARGSGKSKKAAESDAALAALKKLREESELKAGS